MPNAKKNVTIRDQDNTVKVTIATTRVEEVITKLTEKILVPTTKNNQDIETGSKIAKIVDLLRVEHRYNVDGFITQDIGTASPESTDVAIKKTDLKKLLNAGGVLLLNYEDTDIDCNFEKLVITEATSGGSANVTTYPVKFTVVKGENA